MRIEDLADEDWLCGALPSSCRYQVLKLCREAGFEPRISFQSEDYEVIKGFVAGGLGVTILPELAGGHPGIELQAGPRAEACPQGLGGDARERGALARRRADARHPARGLPRLPRADRALRPRLPEPARFLAAGGWSRSGRDAPEAPMRAFATVPGSIEPSPWI